MSWIESHQELGRHPKTRRLARLLDVSLPATVGHLQFLWWWALDFAQDGDLSHYEAQEIADAALWEGEPARFIGALRMAGFLDGLPDGGYSIHDWHDYAGKLIEQRRANAERQRAFQQRRKGQPPPSAPNPVTNGHVTSEDISSNSYVTVSSPSANTATEPYRTVPENKNNAHAPACEETASAVSPAEPAPRDPAWDALNPATNHALPGKAAHPVPKPSRDEQAVTTYQPVVDAYPRRHGVGPDAEAGLLEFVLIAPGDRPGVLQAVQNYAAHPDACKEDGEYVMGIARFLAGGQWRRWLHVAPSGKPARAAPRPPVELSPYQQRQAAKRAAAQQGVQRA